MKVNRTLAIVAFVLLVASVWAYRHDMTRAERFERGQSFLPNLNPDEIAQIVITKGEEVVTLTRGKEHFTISEADGYPAKNETVNRLIRSVLEVGLDKEIGRGDGLVEELELVPGGENTVEIVFSNDSSTAAGAVHLHRTQGFLHLCRIVNGEHSCTRLAGARIIRIRFDQVLRCLVEA